MAYFTIDFLEFLILISMATFCNNDIIKFLFGLIVCLIKDDTEET